MYHNRRILLEICVDCDMDEKIRTYFVATGAAALKKKKRIDHIIREGIYHLKVKVFSNERLGLFSFVQLKYTITQMKKSPSLGNKALSKRFDMFQDYNQRHLWVAGTKREELLTVYNGDQKQKILKFALSTTYLTELPDTGLCVLVRVRDYLQCLYWQAK